MKVNLELQIATNVKTLPHPSQFKKWIKLIFANNFSQFKSFQSIDLNIRIVDEDEIIDLNTTYRNKNKATNVLAFQGQLAQVFNYNVLGDVVICATIIEKEAQQQNKELLSHWAHMVVHGVLHLLGYDHQSSAEANKMEKLEISLMQQLGFASPYHEN